MFKRTEHSSTLLVGIFLLVVLAMLVFFSYSMESGVDNPDETESVSMTDKEQEVLAAYRARCDAMVAKDMNALNQMMADDLVLRHITGATQTKQEWLDCIANEEMRYFEIDIQKINAEVEGDKATVTHTAALDARIYGSRGIWTLSGTSYFENRDGKWLWVNPPK